MVKRRNLKSLILNWVDSINKVILMEILLSAKPNPFWIDIKEEIWIYNNANLWLSIKLMMFIIMIRIHLQRFYKSSETVQTLIWSPALLQWIKILLHFMRKMLENLKLTLKLLMAQIIRELHWQESTLIMFQLKADKKPFTNTLLSKFSRLFTVIQQNWNLKFLFSLIQLKKSIVSVKFLKQS